MTDDSGRLDQLGSILAHNHLALTESGQRDDLSEDVLTDVFRAAVAPPRVRSCVVVIVGAGASKESGLHLGREAAEMLRQRFPVPRDMLEEELARLSSVYRLTREDFETQLLALSKFDHGQQLATHLHDMYARRFCPSLTYEILAHMLKHRFVDAIISMNFDELLDQSIDDEVVDGHYDRIVYDGDCPSDVSSLKDRSTQRLHRPLYIKPHGTASHKSSMRFTRGAYYELPSDIQRLLLELFSGLPVTLITVGFAMASFEINRLFVQGTRRHRNVDLDDDTQSAIYSIDRVALDALADGPLRHYYERGGAIRLRRSLNDTMKELWTAAADHVGAGKVRGIARHDLVARVLGERGVPGSLPPDSRRLQYLTDRMHIEIALAIAKCRGFVTLNQLIRSRAGRYFRLYRQCNGARPVTLFQLCREFGLEPHSYSRETLRLGTGMHEPRTMTVSESDFESWVLHNPLWLNRVIAKLSPDAQRAIRADDCELFTTALKSMYDGEEIEIAPSRPAACNESFRWPLVLTSMTSMRRVSERLLGSQWDLMLAVAETGGWLLRQRETLLARAEKQKLRIKLIIADEALRSSLEETFSDGGTGTAGVDLDILWLPWWLHNQHMTVYQGTLRAMEAIYYERRMRDAFVSPMLLGGDDASAVIDIFVAYMIKAHRFSKELPKRIIRTDEVRELRRRLLQSPQRRMSELVGQPRPDGVAANEPLLSWLQRRYEQANGSVEFECMPTSSDHGRLDVHCEPTVRDILWGPLASSMHSTSRCAVFEHPAIVDPESGIVHAVGIEDRYAIRLTDHQLLKADQPGYSTTGRAGGADLDLRSVFGPGWVFGRQPEREAAWLAANATGPD